MEKGCNGSVKLNKKEKIKMGHQYIKTLCVCDMCGRLYTSEGRPLNYRKYGFFISEGVIVLKTSRMDKQGEQR
ncbi:MAG: hypothetical protein HYT36_02705 [Candidatus Staskawiczbacteria bacterium]|nr:hypothetical protein [Candidatus Staskawiczbacteria bacterium]